MLSDGEMDRYRRQIPHLWPWKRPGKAKKEHRADRRRRRVGSAIATYMAAAGVGTIRIADNDVLEPGNMNRQILYRNKDIGRPKAESAEEQIKAINPYVAVEAHHVAIDETNVYDLVRGADVIMDAMDNFPTRYILNEAGIDLGVPFFHGAVDGFYGQVSTLIPGMTPCLRCIVPEPPPDMPVPTIGVTCGAIGCIQATEAIKYILGKGSCPPTAFFSGTACEATSMSSPWRTIRNVPAVSEIEW